jgi:CheY-like chemotaxis protein
MPQELEARSRRAASEAVDAAAGLRLAAEQQPELVLMDIELPGMNGIEALKALRANASTAAIPVIAFTASVMPQDRREIRGAGFDGFISKPIALREFVSTIQTTLVAKVEESTVKSQRRILVVDDTPANVKLLADLLAQQAYEVVTALSGEEALSRMAERRPDLVLLVAARLRSCSSICEASPRSPRVQRRKK